jgi:GH15 family glucan-1,4-alpha-glucosidase
LEVVEMMVRAVVTAVAAALTAGALTAPAHAAGLAGPIASYEGENAVLVEADRSSRYPGFDGTGYADSSATAGGSVTFTVTVPRTDFYTLRVRYGNGGGGDAIRSVTVNGRAIPKSIEFAHQFMWSIWRDAEVALRLTAGTQAVGLTFRSGDRGRVLVDSLDVLDRTNASQTSSTSQLLNNWDDLVAIAQSATLFPKDTEPYGPTLAELHYKGDWPTNQLRSEAAYFRGLTDRSETSPPSWDSTLAFDAGGVLTQHYLDQSLGLRGVRQRRQAVPIDVSKEYILPPQRKFIIVRYRLENVTGQLRSFDFMDHVELANKQAPEFNHPDSSAQTHTVDYDGARGGYVADMTRTGQFWLAQGAFQPMDSHGAGGYKAGPTYPGDSFQDVQRKFDRDGTLNNEASYTGHLVSVGLARRITLEPYQSRFLSFVYSVQGARDAATAAIDQALAQSPDSWARATRNAYASWLAKGRRASQADQGVNEAFDISLITLKQSQQPEFGMWVAATSPAYEYKVWPRDAAVTAIGMDATGHYDEAGRYYRWMASVVEGDPPSQPHFFPGTWYTNYGFWRANQPIRFVEPEFDSSGLFLVGVWKHYEALALTDPAAARAFVTDPVVARAIRLAANFPADHIDGLGFGPADQSIWEERYEIATFTQATYAAGDRAASKIAQATGDVGNAGRWSQAAETIRAAIVRPTNTPGRPGLWYDPTQPGSPPEGCFATGVFHGPNCYSPLPSTGDRAPYFIRGIYPIGTMGGNPTLQLDAEVDSSTGLLWVLGLISATEPKAIAHQAKVMRFLAKNEFGISRHEEDDFYYSSIYSPGGRFEANVDSPIWPQPVMYMAMLERWQGTVATTRTRLQWYASITPFGYEPPGEAVDRSTEEPLVSTASEPVTGGWFQLATLVEQGAFDTRLWP